MTRGTIVRPPWRRQLCGLSDMAGWAGPEVKTSTIAWHLKRYTRVEPVEYSNMGAIYRWPEVKAALLDLGYTEGGGPLGEEARKHLKKRVAGDD